MRLKITGRVREGKPATATGCEAASLQEALGYESRGKEAKGRENDGSESVAVYTCANGKREKATQGGTLKGNKEGKTQ